MQLENKVSNVIQCSECKNIKALCKDNTEVSWCKCETVN